MLAPSWNRTRCRVSREYFSGTTMSSHGHQDFWELPGDDREDVRLGLANDCKQIPSKHKRLVVPLVRSNYEQLVQTVERGFLYPLNQSTPSVITYISQSGEC